MVVDPHDIGRALGRLEQQGEGAQEARRVIYQKLEEQGKDTSDILMMMQDVKGSHERLEKRINDEIVPHVEDYRKVKQRGIGILLATGLTAGGIGAASFKYIAGIFK